MQVYRIYKSLNSVFIYTASTLLELGLHMESETSYSADKLVSASKKKSRLYFYYFNVNAVLEVPSSVDD